jgi:hypothetical protein
VLTVGGEDVASNFASQDEKRHDLPTKKMNLLLRKGRIRPTKKGKNGKETQS